MTKNLIQSVAGIRAIVAAAVFTLGLWGAPTPVLTQEAPTKKVLLIGVDGFRPSVLGDEIHTPNLDELRANGAWSDSAQVRLLTQESSSDSSHGWSSMLTGVWEDKHGVESNRLETTNLDEYPDFLTRIEQVNPDMYTFSISDWPVIANYPIVSDAVDVKIGLNAEGNMTYPVADSLSAMIAANYLANAEVDAAFVYFGNPDVVAHNLGTLVQEYRDCLEALDRQIGVLVRAIRSRPSYGSEDWLILLSSDHGHRPEGGHGGRTPDELNIPFLVSGPSATRGRLPGKPDQVDVAVTALTHLGVPIDPAWGLAGKAVGLR